MADDYGLDLGPAFREALIDATPISSLLSVYNEEPAVFTRRPVPDSADFPMIIVNPPAAIHDEDGLTSDRPVETIYIGVYGIKGSPGSPEDQTRTVDQMAFAIRQLFHRQKWALRVGGFHVIDIRATGPVPAPVDDDKTIGRMVTVIVRLGRN